MDNLELNFDEIVEWEKKIHLEERIAYFEGLKKIAEAKRIFIETGKIAPCIREEVALSWERSIKKLSPYKSRLHRLPEKEKEDCLRKNELLINCGLYVMDSVSRTMNDRCYIMHISDKDSNIICVDNSYSRELISREAIVPGAACRENLSGTNSICLSKIHGKDMEIHGAEHFLLYQHNVSCCTSVIRNGKNDVIGAVTLTFDIRIYNKLLSTISAIAARMIEKEIVKHSFSNVLEHTINNSIESIIVTDSNYNTIMVNTKLLELLKIKNGDKYKLNIIDLLPEVDFKGDLQGIFSSDMHEVSLFHNGRQYHLSFRAQPAYNDESFDYIIFFFQEISSLIDLSRRFSGHYNYYTFSDIITGDPAMLKLIEDSKRIANLDVPILITGNSGTGKELFAQSIHSCGARRDKPFLAVNCAALPNNLIESELFGYDKGAFTGASMGKPGKFELADGGTIFLDEIGELPLDVQAKILRILDDYKVSRIGGTKEKKLDIRVIAATNRNLNEEVLKNNFRLDLFYRLNVLNIHIPPLISRSEDIRLLSEHFLSKLNERNNPKEKKYLNEKTMDYLYLYDWPGNVRELQNAVNRAYFLSDNPVITEEFFTFSLRPNFNVSSANEVHIKPDEQAAIESALKQHDGQVLPTAKFLKIPVSSLYRKIKKYNIKRAPFFGRKIS
ncbi:MAG: sigma 54-interacting transcriptional regulator [Deltaproteobacteria bacterium]|jgi:transcriptional regulator with PAS, ATPase and Fis domain|nr:sigma 54-interacting transcriptional regulator [Deltaproteobacteria bacterium]